MGKSKHGWDELVLVLIVAVLIIIVSIGEKQNPKLDTEKILDAISGVSETNGDMVIGQSQLTKIQQADYTSLKNNLKIKKDFCVYIKEGDGRVILAKGSPRLSQDGVECRE